MDNTIDISEIDKKDFKCFKFQDGSIYYGEVAYIHPTTHSVILKKDLDSFPEEIIQTFKIVRHGVGAQLFLVNDNACLCKYEGEWIKDSKNGKGLCIFPDKSHYEGNFVNDLFEGYGKYVWPNNDNYIGMWKAGRMEGDGEFKHHDGHFLRGTFKNNYHIDREIIQNPFLPIEKLDLFRSKNQEYLAKLKSQNEKFSRSNLFKISSQQELIRSIEETIKNNKTPLILRSRENLIKKQEIYKLFVKEFHEFDLRYSYIKLRESLINNEEVFEEIKFTVVDAMTKGLFLIMNFDDCSIKYEELFDPDIKEFYGKMMLSPFMWTPTLFSQSKCWKSHLKNIEELKLDKNFKFIVYSKFVIEPDLQEHDLINIIEKRFEKSFTLLNVNVLLISNFKL